MKKIFAVAALTICSQLHAQDSTATLDEVTLTASKFSTKTTSTGKVVRIITRGDIDRAGSRDLAQVITEFGGLFINGFNSNAGKEKNIYLRGAKVDHTLITIDGIPVYDASGIGSNFDIRNLSIDNIERIEILKGSQGTLYGSDAIAGVINIITRKGGTKPFNFSGIAQYGSYDSRRVNAAVNGSVKRFDYNVGFSHFKTDGFSEARKPVNATGAFDRDGYTQHNVEANFGIQAAQGVRIQPFFRYGRFKGSLDQDAFTDEKDYTNENKNLQAGARNTIDLGAGQLHVLYQLTRTNRSYLDDSTGSRNGFYIFNDQSYKATEHFAEAFIVYPFQSVKLTAGADLRASNTGYSATQLDPYAPLAHLAFSGDSVKQQQVGVYAALNYNRDAFGIEGGGRYNHHSEYGSNSAFNINPSYFIRKRVKVFANASTGYKTPSLYQLFSAYGNRALDPETSLSLEGGAQLFSKDGQSNLRATYFNRHVKDAIAFFFDPVTFRSNYINQDEQKDHGVEVEGNSTLGKIELKAIYTYVTGKITTVQAGKDTTYFNLLRRPKNTLNLSIGSQVTNGLYLSMGVNAVGERKDVYFDPVTFQSQSITLKNYVLVNFYAEYGFAKNRLKLFADLRNAFNEQYMDIYGYNTAGINAYGGLRFRL